MFVHRLLNYENVLKADHKSYRDARRHNASITASSQAKLRPLLRPAEKLGSSVIVPPVSPSSAFPPDVKVLFRLTSITVSKLLEEYKITPDGERDAEKDLNWFISAIGVSTSQPSLSSRFALLFVLRLSKYHARSWSIPTSIADTLNGVITNSQYTEIGPIISRIAAGSISVFSSC